MRTSRRAAAKQRRMFLWARLAPWSFRTLRWPCPLWVVVHGPPNAILCEFKHPSIAGPTCKVGFVRAAAAMGRKHHHHHGAHVRSSQRA